MIQKHLLFIPFFLSATLLFAAKEPDWLRNYREVFPDTKYIAQKASAETKENSQTEAIAQIARYFQTNVAASLKTSVQSIEKAGSVEERTNIENDVELTSDVSLFAIETTEPFYVKKEKKWHCLAFIEREKAWTQYEPNVENAKNEFYAIYQKTEEESEPLLKCSLLSKTWKSGMEFLKTLEFARILDSQKEKKYADDRNFVSEIPAMIEVEKEKCRVYVEVSGDQDGIIATSVAEALEESSLVISAQKEDCAYIAKVEITDNESGSDPIAIFPSVDFSLVGKNGKSAYAIKIKSQKKAISYTIENARKKAYPQVAEQIKETVKKDMREKFGF